MEGKNDVGAQFIAPLHHKNLKQLPRVLLLLGTENGVDRGAADGTGALEGGFPILGCNPLGVPHIGLLFALDTIILICHVRVASFASTLEQTYGSRRGKNST